MSLAGAPSTASLRGIDAWNGVERRAAVRPILEAEIISPQAWDGLAASFDGVLQEQLFTYAAARWPAAVPEAVLFRLDGEAIGGTLVMLQRLPFGVGTIAVCKWGPILKDTHHPDSDTLYAGMVDALVADYAVRRGMMLSVLPRAATGPDNRQYGHLLARGFKRSTTLRFPGRYLVNLRLTDDEQRRSLGQKWRYHLNRAEKAGLSFERAGLDRIGEFDALYQAMTDRKNFPDHSSYDTLPALLGAEPEALRPELFFVSHADEVVAGAIVFKAGDTGVYLFGATNDKALPLRAGYFLHWHIIRWLRDNTSARWYDLGGTDGFQGLHQFKKGMVGSAGVLSDVPPVANYAARWLPFFLGTAAFEGRELFHRLLRQRDRLPGGKALPNQRAVDGDG